MSNPRSTARPEVWFVAGYGRSGSTITASWLASWLESTDRGPVHSVGELGPWLRSSHPEHRSPLICSCGSSVENCRTWTELLANDSNPSSRRTERMLSGWIGTLIPMTMLGKLIHQQSLFKPERYLADHQGVVVDASKTVVSNANAPRIWAALGCEVSVVTVVRPQRSVLASRRKAFERQERKPPFLWRGRTVTSRFMATALGGLATRRLGGYRVDYGELPSFERLASTLGIGLPEGELGPAPAHMAGGNRMRYASQ